MTAPSTVSPLQRWVLPAAEILTIGIPFCAFKILTGVIALGWFAPLGYLLVALGVVDAVFNLVNLVGLLALQRRIGAVCLTDLAFRGELGLAIDVFVSFALVALVVGLGLLKYLPPWTLTIWNIGVVLNVLGAGVGRLFAALRRPRVASV